MTKWEFYDFVTDTAIDLEINPSEVDMGGVTKTITEAGTTSPKGQRILFEGRREPQVMAFTGVILTQEQYEVFEDWSNKNYQFRLTDDLGRIYWIYITNFSPSRRRNPTVRWLADYNIDVTVLDWSS